MLFDDWFLENLVCPRDKGKLRLDGSHLFCDNGHVYPIVNGIPVMLLDEVAPTLHVISGSIKASNKIVTRNYDNYQLDTLGVDQDQKAKILEEINKSSLNVDPVVNYLVAHTNGLMYKHLVGKLKNYPVPKVELPSGPGKALLDIGCSWGRWCIAAASKNYKPVGLDPSLGAVLAAQRVSQQLKLNIKYVVGDARYLPFRDCAFDVVYSYSVFQHFSIDDAILAVKEVGRILSPFGYYKIQLANAYGPRSFYHLLKRRFRQPRGFEVRYWSPQKMKEVFNNFIGNAALQPDCYFGLGLQKADSDFMPLWKQTAISISEVIKQAAKVFHLLVYIADSIFIQGNKHLRRSFPVN